MYVRPSEVILEVNSTPSLSVILQMEINDYPDYALVGRGYSKPCKKRALFLFLHSPLAPLQKGPSLMNPFVAVHGCALLAGVCVCVGVCVSACVRMLKWAIVY